MKKLYTSLYLSFGIISTSAQEVAWQRNIPSSTQDFLTGLTTTLDRQFLISGSSIQSSKKSALSSLGGSSQNNGYDFHLIKLDQQGNFVWEKYYGGNSHDFLTATVATQEGGFLVAGTTFSESGVDKTSHNYGGSDVWVIKLSENGEREWQTTVGAAYDDEAKSVIQTTDSGYFIAGNSQASKKGFGSKDAWIVKLDKSGKIINQVIFGGTGLDEIEKIIATKDGGCLAAVYSRSADASLIELNVREQYEQLTKEEITLAEYQSKLQVTVTADDTDFLKIRTEHFAKRGENYGEGDYWIVKFDKNGGIQWQKNYGGKDDDHVKTLANSANGYIIGGESRSSLSGNKLQSVKEGTDLWIISLDTEGTEQWQKSYNFGNLDVLMSLNTIGNAEGTSSNGYLLGGFTQAAEKKTDKDEIFWILYIDNMGQEVWRKHIEGKSRKANERLISASLMRDGNYILAGSSAEELGKENWKIVMLGDKQVKELFEKKDIQIYPNPVDEYCYVEIGVAFKEAEIGIYETSGRQIKQIKTKMAVTKVNTSTLPQGVYVVTAKTENNKLNAKIIKR